MLPPDQDLRAAVARSMEQVESEEEFTWVLGDIQGKLSETLAAGFERDAPEELVATIEAWAALLSHAVTGFYGPSAAPRPSLAGWGAVTAARLRSAANTLEGPLQRVAHNTGAHGYSISVGYPWGVSVSLYWRQLSRP